MRERLPGEHQNASFHLTFIVTSNKTDSAKEVSIIQLSKIYKQAIEKFNQYIESQTSNYRHDMPIFTAINENTEELHRAELIYKNSEVKIIFNLLLQYKYNDIIFNYDSKDKTYKVEGMISENDIKEHLTNPFRRFLSVEFLNNGFTIIHDEIDDIQYSDESDIYDSILYHSDKDDIDQIFNKE